MKIHLTEFEPCGSCAAVPLTGAAAAYGLSLLSIEVPVSRGKTRGRTCVQEVLPIGPGSSGLVVQMGVSATLGSSCQLREPAWALPPKSPAVEPPRDRHAGWRREAADGAPAPPSALTWRSDR